MAAVSEFNKYGEELEARLLLKTSPIAIKMLKTEADIPKGAIRPRKDTGSHLDLCQGFAMSRRERAVVAMLKEDHWCYVPVIAHGLAEPPDYVLEGNIGLSLEGCGSTGRQGSGEEFPPLGIWKIHRHCVGPLRRADFQPDLVAIYCNSAQLRCLLVGIRYKKGYRVTSTLEPGGACVQCTVPVLKTGECQVALPCGGDRRNALAQDDELIFSVPAHLMEDLMAG